MDAAQVVALVYPTWGRPPLLVGQRPEGAYDGNNSPMIAPHTGSPAITVPMGFTGGWSGQAGLSRGPQHCYGVTQKGV